MKKIAVLISNKGKGSNLQAIANAVKSQKINAKIVVVISDTQEAPGLAHARHHKLKIEISPKKENLLLVLKKYNPDYVALAGWKQIITDDVIKTYKNKILNVHPGLIPDLQDGYVKNPDGTKALWNKGKLAQKAIQNFLDEKATYAGSSVHFLTEEFDFGPVLERAFEKIKKSDTVESLYSRLKKKEHEIYTEVLKNLSLATVLVIDGGGRGSTLVDKYLQSTHVGRVLAAPGNDLMMIGTEKPVKIFPKVKTTNIKNLLKIVSEYNVDLVDVAQDDAVAAGITDALQKMKVKVFGPTKAAGQIEWDKAWARNFMKANNIPVPAFKICKSEKEGIDFIKSQKESEWYIKASGLALGKGVIYAKNNKEAEKAILQMKSFGKSGKVFLLEECLKGEEFTAFAVVDAEDFLVIGHAQDHKTIFDGNKGPNTGGIGCTSTPLVVNKKIEIQVNNIFKKTVKGFASLKRPYRGILYLGAMLDRNDKVNVIEFNARWGDPEVEVVLPAIKNDLYELTQMVIAGKIKKIKIQKDNLYRVVITACAKGYPRDYSSVNGKRIFGLENLLKNSDKSLKIFGAAVKTSDNQFTVAGGRLFHVMAQGKNVLEARKIAYDALSKVKVEGNNLHYRHDIGYRDVERLKNK